MGWVYDQVMCVMNVSHRRCMEMRKRVLHIPFKSLWIATLYTLVQLAHGPCTLVDLHTPIMQCVHMGGLTMFPLSWLGKRGKKKIEIKPNHVYLIMTCEYKVMEWRCVKSNKGMGWTWSTNMCEECLSSLEKGNDRVSSSKSFEILQDKYPLYTLIQLVQLSCTLLYN